MLERWAVRSADQLVGVLYDIEEYIQLQTGWALKVNKAHRLKEVTMYGAGTLFGYTNTETSLQARL